MSHTSTSRQTSERGAIILHVAIATLAIIVFSALVVDYGVMWVARTQAQAAADAGALAGALELAQYATEDITVDEAVLLAAQTFVAKTAVWGEATDPLNVVMATSATGPLYPQPPPSPPECAVPGCVRVDVMRGVKDHGGRPHNNVLPTFFAQLVGITSQGVRATATAQVAAGNASSCLKPWLIPDRWTDTNGNGKYDTGEVYQAPTAGPPADPGTGYTTADIGTALTLKEGDPSKALSSSDYFEIGDAMTYEEAITDCEITATIGDTLTTLPGNRQGPTKHAVGDLIDSDKYATWDPAQKAVINSNGTGTRIVPVGLFSPAQFATVASPHGNFNLTLVNLLGFFIMGVDADGTVHGVIVSDVGELLPGGKVGPTSSFVKIVRLIR